MSIPSPELSHANPGSSSPELAAHAATPLPTYSESAYQDLLAKESKKWGDHLQVEASGRWLSWLQHPLIQENYRRRSRLDGMHWIDWVKTQLGGPAECSLDLGCGAGETSLAVYASGASLRLEGYDVSSPRVAEAERKRQERGIPGHFQVADVNRVELPEKQYDLIFSSHSFHHFLHLEEIMQRVHSALTPHGYFILEEYVGPTQFQWTEQQMSLVATRLSLLPERLRTTASGYLKFAEDRPPVEDVIAESPFESIRSAEIVPLFQKFFDIASIIPLGGTMQHLLYNGIMHQFPMDDEEALQHVRGLIALENELIDGGFLPSDFMLLVGRKRI